MLVAFLPVLVSLGIGVTAGALAASLGADSLQFKLIRNVPSEIKDPRLLARLARQGDAFAWERLVGEHQQPVFRLAYLLLGDPDEAQDVAQETFIRAYHALHRFDNERPLRPWLLRIAANLAYNRQRSLRRYLAALKRLGCALAIDDFGTGYSSLAYLKRFQLDVLKIDKSFVDGLGRDANDSAVVGAIVSLARSLGLAMVAEGVESQRQFDALAGFGGDDILFQGYLLGHPVPADELERRLAATAG